MALQVLNGPIIAAGQSLSAGLDCTGGDILRLTMPAGWTGANLSFQISTDGLGYNDLFTVEGHEVVIPVVAGTAVIVAHLGDALSAVAFLKVRSGTRAFPIAQPVQRDFAVTVEDHTGPALQRINPIREKA